MGSARLVLLAAALAVGAGGCAQPEKSPLEKSGPDAAGSQYTDGIGRTVFLLRHPRRIISLAPSVTEVIYLLGAQERLIGVSSHCDWPEDARRKPRVGSLLNPNYEIILDARPDLVIASTAGNDRAATLKLADFGIPLYVTAPRSVDTIFGTVLAISRITDSGDAGEKLVAQMKTRLADIERRLQGLPPTRAFFITWFDPLLAPGSRTFENDLLRLAGVDSITSGIDEFYPRYSLERLLEEDPDAVLTVRHGGNPLPDLRRLPGWQTLKAVRAGRVIVLSEVLQHPSPRFVDGIEELAMRLHPERFR